MKNHLRSCSPIFTLTTPSGLNLRGAGKVLSVSLRTTCVSTGRCLLKYLTGCKREKCMRLYPAGLQLRRNVSKQSRLWCTENTTFLNLQTRVMQAKFNWPRFYDNFCDFLHKHKKYSNPQHICYSIDLSVFLHYIIAQK